MQPYQEATEEVRRQGELPLKIAKNAAAVGSTAATAYFGGSALNRVLPFLSKYVPEDLAIKGLNKVDPRYGKFIEKALAAGKSFDEVKDFIGSKIEEGGQGQTPPKQNKNIIEQESPELHQFMLDEIRKGRKPIEAAAIAQNDKRFSDIVKKLMKKHKTPWSSIIESIFGSGEMALPQQGQQQEMQQPVQQGNPQAKQQLLQAMQALSQQLKQ
jgi:hypothetical protein